MTNETTQTSNPGQFDYTIGARLKSAREAMGMDQKEVASHLRLHEKVIHMLEKDTYPNDLPIIFLRGYIRSYGKFVQISEYEIKEALKPIQPPAVQAPEPERLIAKPVMSEHTRIMLMRTSTYAIGFTLLGLVWVWWHNHSANTTKTTEHALSIPFDMGVPAAAHESASTTTELNPVQAGAATSVAIKIPLAPQVNNALSTAAAKPVATTANAPVSTNDVNHVVTAQNTKNATKRVANEDNDDDYDDQE